VPARLRRDVKGTPVAAETAAMGAKLGVENPGPRNIG